MIRTEKLLGKIKEVKFGQCYDRPFLFGLFLTFESGCTGVSGQVAMNLNPECQYDSPTDRHIEMQRVLETINALLVDAKVSTVDELVDKPVELTITDRMLTDYRILTEVL